MHQRSRPLVSTLSKTGYVLLFEQGRLVDSRHPVYGAGWISKWDGAAVGGGEMKWSEKKWNKGFIIFAGIHFSRLKETSGDVTNDEGIPRELNDGLIFSPGRADFK